MSVEEGGGGGSCYIGTAISPEAGLEKGRYVVRGLLGVGVYGKVFLCEDLKYSGAHVALKVVRRDPLYRKAAQSEVKVLTHLNGTPHTATLLRAFEMHGHVCMAMELLGETLSDHLQRNGPLPEAELRLVGRTLLEALAGVHAKGVVHTDIKPDNVLLGRREGDPVDRGVGGLTLVDFGSAVVGDAWRQSLIGTREYRSPETLLPFPDQQC
ncbi:kinase-like domain-containing protein [Baffinella frigidus]|nr:kinase-like domain-containing protein [Cryptophyta sp. CCMP2293]